MNFSNIVLNLSMPLSLKSNIYASINTVLRGGSLYYAYLFWAFKTGLKSIKIDSRAEVKGTLEHRVILYHRTVRVY